MVIFREMLYADLLSFTSPKLVVLVNFSRFLASKLVEIQHHYVVPGGE